MMCTGAIDPVYVIKALVGGADAVLIAGCHPGDCHYSEGNYKARRHVAQLKSILEETGFDPERIWLRWISASEGKLFAETIAEMTQAIRAIGPTPVRQALVV